MIVTYYPHSKKFIIYNLQILNFLQIQSLFQNLKISRVFYHMYVGSFVHDIEDKVVAYDTIN
jgi:hypothetical protein